MRPSLRKEMAGQVVRKGIAIKRIWLRNVKGMPYNHKRVYRIYRQLELNLRIKPRRSRSLGSATADQ